MSDNNKRGGRRPAASAAVKPPVGDPDRVKAVRRRNDAERLNTISLLQATLESTHDGILVVDRNGKTVLSNRRFAVLWQIPEEIMVSRDDQKALQYVLDQLKEPGAFLQKVRELYENPGAESFDLLEFKDGRFFERYSQPQRIGKKVVGRVWSFRDVSAGKKVEQSLRESEERYRTLLDNVEDGYYEVDLDGNYLFCNEAFARILGYGLQELRGMNFKDFTTPETAERVYRIFHAVFETGRPAKDIAVETVGKDGTERSVEFSVFPIKSAEGWKTGFKGTTRDITERKRMEEATRESERRYRILFEAAQEAILVMKGVIFVDCNPAAERLLGCSRTEILGSTPFRFSPERQPDGRPSEEKGTALVRKSIRQGPQRFEWVHQGLDGRRFEAEVSLSQFHIEGQSYLFVMERDITDQKRAQEELRALSLIDELTGLYNRRGFLTLARQQLKMADRMQRGIFLLFADLDDLKYINDHYGHPEGDRALQAVAVILKETFREPDLLARIGGDEFVVLAIEGTSAAQAEILSGRFTSNLSAANQKGHRPYTLSVSQGVVRHVPGRLTSIEELMAQADRLMYEKKREKKRADTKTEKAG